jgi:GTP-binding protein EngB required for normal cell division
LIEGGAQKLIHAQLGWTPSDTNAAAALKFRIHDGDLRLIAMVGGASGGKSTLFNSLVGREVSRVSAHAHETLGPIAACATGDIERVQSAARDRGLLPEFQFASVDIESQSTGSTDTVTLFAHHRDDLPNTMLLDTPDVTSRQSDTEGAVTRRLLPWFDAVILVVDEERFFDAAVFDDCLDLIRETAPDFFVLFNCTERADPLPEQDIRRLLDHARSKHAADAAVAPHVPGAGYRSMTGATLDVVRNWIHQVDPSPRRNQLREHLRRRGAAVLERNMTCTRRFAQLTTAVDRRLDELTCNARLTTDLLTNEERRLLGVGHRFVPLYGALRSMRSGLSKWSGVSKWFVGKRTTNDVNLEKRADQLTETLRRNFELRFQRAADAVEQAILDSRYVLDADHDAPDDQESTAPTQPQWNLPDFDAATWAARIRDHIDAWNQESTHRARRSDAAGLILSGPLLLADLLFLGGAGMSLTWSVASLAALVGGKTLSTALQSSDAFRAYQTTVAAYQAFLRESLEAQCRRNLDALPKRHLPVSDPAMQAVLTLSTPRATP